MEAIRTSLSYSMEFRKILVWGPLLFTLYIGKLFDIIKHHLADAHAYADDTQLCLSFKPDSTKNEIDVVYAVQSCIKDIKAWMTVDKLNDDKSLMTVKFNLL